ncbi:hypothetical protein HPB49_010594 [Dermacentor silvarum]|uniref:Uncharacterized protein n=1 Tax=Dermacentor silvarum TaxID=543639 RepID=A0ACB8DIX2_DERSI|nr:hypothetical protein HPB49_010594 [Dermacentor silvarum]
MAENRSTGYRPPVSSNGGDDAVSSTSRAGREEASAGLEYDGRIPNGTWGDQRNTQYYPAKVASTPYGYTDTAENGSAGYWPPVSSSGGDEAVPSTSSAGIDEASSSSENDERGTASGMAEERNSGYTPPAFTSFGDEAIPRTSREDAVGSSSTLDNYTRISHGFWGGQWNAPYYPADVTYTMLGHADMAENRSTGYRPPVSSNGGDDAVPSTSRAGRYETAAGLEYDGSGGDEAVPSTSRAGMEDASASSENDGRNATGTEENERHELCGVCGNVYTRLHALRRHAAEPYGDEFYTCDACGLPSVKITKVERHYQKSTKEKLYKCETCDRGSVDGHMFEMLKCYLCGDSFRDDIQLATHLVTHRGGPLSSEAWFAGCGPTAPTCPALKPILDVAGIRSRDQADPEAGEAKHTRLCISLTTGDGSMAQARQKVKPFQVPASVAGVLRNAPPSRSHVKLYQFGVTEGRTFW